MVELIVRHERVDEGGGPQDAVDGVRIRLVIVGSLAQRAVPPEIVDRSGDIVGGAAP
jgi:hypothetical protein